MNSEEVLDNECDFCEGMGCSACDPEHHVMMPLKWICDGCFTIDEAVTNLKALTQWLEKQKSQEFELDQPVDNGHFFMSRPKFGEIDGS